MLVDLTDLDLADRLPNDVALRALRTRAAPMGLTLVIRPADHRPERDLYPLRLELVDRRDARRVIAGYTATDDARAGVGLRTLLAVLP